MGSIFTRPPATAELEELPGFKLALDGGAPLTLAEAAAGTRAPVVLCLGGERLGLPRELVKQADAAARIPLREGGPDSLNVAMAATVALYELRSGMAADA